MEMVVKQSEGEGGKDIRCASPGRNRMVAVALAMAVQATMELPLLLGDTLAAPGYLDPMIYVYLKWSQKKQAVQ